MGSRKVRKILRLEARARRLLTRYERALIKATRAKAHAHALLDEAHGLEYSLTGAQLGSLRRARAETVGSEAAGHSPAPDRSSMTTST
jgi:hypothetical protein